jgi:hypothetical protein
LYSEEVGYILHVYIIHNFRQSIYFGEPGSKKKRREEYDGTSALPQLWRINIIEEPVRQPCHRPPGLPAQPDPFLALPG